MRFEDEWRKQTERLDKIRQKRREEMKIKEAAKEYIARQGRYTHPDGKFDRGGRWYPSDKEARDCCARIRYPSRGYPYSYLVHCRSAQHVAELFGVSRGELLAEVKKIRKEEA